ncbi:N-acetylmuramoyl-L-alanine amidase-like domain-containing protein [Spongiimicrobium salis]|uniref:N-acetylmuramoyl-L-alanine amidase-like domain-containing protein n=1 Tax=Spongiimicrobium salis TaxID=1667022 RepID=UPI00374D1A19
MKILIFFSILIGIGPFLHAQDIVCSAEDRQAFETKIAAIQDIKTTDFGTTLVTVGKTFLGTAYVAKTLEIGSKESLVVNLQGLDCTTYIENVLAFGLLLKNKTYGFDDFLDALENIRYRDGELNGYASRLHYFSEWVRDNEKKGLVQDITSVVGGKEISKDIDFMSTHRELYPFLKNNDKNFKKIQETEIALNSTPQCILSQEDIEANEHLIKSGDIIALATSIKGLDVTHTGIALKMKNGRLHLLHASTVGEVTITKEPLVDYLKKIKKNIGITVARPL